MPENYFDPIEEKREAIRDSGVSTGTRVFFCKYEDRNGDWVPVPRKSRYSDGLNQPASWEDELICTRVRYEPDGPAQPTQSAGNQHFAYCRLTAEYAAANPLDTTWSVRTRGAADQIQMAAFARYASTGEQTDLPVTRVFPKSFIDVTRVFVYSHGQIAYMDANECKINGTRLVAPWGNVYEPETLLFLNYDQDDYWDTVRGKRLNRITFHFEKKPYSHNLAYCISGQRTGVDPFFNTEPPEVIYESIVPPPFRAFEFMDMFRE